MNERKFAWRPIRMVDGQWVWRKWVRRVERKIMIDHEGSTATLYEYHYL
jgi:hypothetical protein